MVANGAAVAGPACIIAYSVAGLLLMAVCMSAAELAVKGMNAERFLLRDGTNVPISKKFYQDAKKKYMEFLLREEI